MNEDTVRCDDDIIQQAGNVGAQSSVVRDLGNEKTRQCMRDALESTGLKAFLSPEQGAAVIAVSIGLNVIAILPTGSGKSLIYRLSSCSAASPGSSSPECTLVLAPVVAPVRDGASSNMLGGSLLGSVFVDANTPHEEREIIFRRLKEKDPSLRELHLTPAMLVESAPLRAALQFGAITRVVLDEFHTLIEWQDFYESMDEKCYAIVRLPGRPQFILLSATADTETVASVLGRLSAAATVIRAPNIRPNVHLEVTLVPSNRLDRICVMMAAWIKSAFPNDEDKGV